MLSMTQSTESKEKKEIWGREDVTSGLGSSPVLLQNKPPSFPNTLSDSLASTGKPIPLPEGIKGA